MLYWQPIYSQKNDESLRFCYKLTEKTKSQRNVYDKGHLSRKQTVTRSFFVNGIFGLCSPNTTTMKVRWRTYAEFVLRKPIFVVVCIFPNAGTNLILLFSRSFFKEANNGTLSLYLSCQVKRNLFDYKQVTSSN